MKRPWFLRLAFWIGVVVFCAVGGNELRWSKKIPFDGAPDEADHYAVVKFVADHGRLPRYGEDNFAVHLMGKNRHRFPPDMSPEHLQMQVRGGGALELRVPYLFSPQAPYWLNGIVARCLGGASEAKARGFDGFCIALAALCTYAAGLLLWGKVWAAAVAALCFGLWPQVSFVGAYVNDDAYAILVLAVFVLAAAWVQRDGFGRKQAIAHGLALGALAAAKIYVYAVFPLVLVWWGFLWRRQGKVFLTRLAWSAGIAALIAVPWFLRNAILYDGDFTGRRTMAARAREYIDSLPPSVREKTHLLFSQKQQGITLSEALKRGFVRHSMESFWGRFGWMHLRFLPSAYGRAFQVLAVALGFSLLCLPLLRASGGLRTGVPHLFALPYLALLIGLGLYNCLTVDFQPQGRYFLTCVPALCLQLVDAPARGKWWLEPLAWALLAFFLQQNLTAYRTVLG